MKFSVHCCQRTFLSGLDENSAFVVDAHERDLIVVENVLRVLEAVVRRDELLDDGVLQLAELVEHDDVEHLSAALVVERILGLTQLVGRPVQIPDELLDRAEDEPQQLEQRHRHYPLDQVSLALEERHICRPSCVPLKSNQIESNHLLKQTL